MRLGWVLPIMGRHDLNPVFIKYVLDVGIQRTSYWDQLLRVFEPGVQLILHIEIPQHDLQDERFRFGRQAGGAPSRFQ